jgi:hypothetical protein
MRGEKVYDVMGTSIIVIVISIAHSGIPTMSMMRQKCWRFERSNEREFACKSSKEMSGFDRR